MNIIHDLYPPTTCPSWCVLPDGHGDDIANVDLDGALYVRHRRPIADVSGFSLDVEQLVITHLDGPVETLPAEIVVNGWHGIDPAALASAAQLAAGGAR